jgi:hypothetical protein
MMPVPFASVGKASNDAGAEQSRGADPAVGTKAVMTLPDLGQARRLARDVLLLRYASMRAPGFAARRPCMLVPDP